MTAAARRVDLDVLRVLAVMGVVAIHTAGAIVTNAPIRGSGTWWVAVAVDLGAVWTVPVFVMVSGALLLGSAGRLGPVAFYRRRFLRILPAFVVWQLFYILVVRWLMLGQTPAPGAVAGWVASGDTFTHLYFLWLIAGLYLVAPVVAPFLAAGGRRRAVTLAAVLVVATAAWLVIATALGQPPTLNALTQWAPYLGFFVAGWALREVRLGTLGRGVVIAVIAVGLAEIVLQYAFTALRPEIGLVRVLGVVAPVSYFGPVVAAVSIAVFLLAGDLLRTAAPPAWLSGTFAALSDAAFGVYLVHFVLLIGLPRLLPVFGTSTPDSLTPRVLLWGAVVVLSFAIALVLRRVPVVRRLF